MLRRTALAVFALAVAGFIFSSHLSSQQASFTILSKDSRRAIATTTVNEQEYVALDELAGLFQLNVREDQLGMLVVTYKGKSILLTPDKPFGSVGGRVIALPAPTIRSNRRWLVSVDVISRGLALVYDTKITLRRPSRLVILGDLRVPRVQVRYETAGPAARLTIDATPRAASTIALDGDSLVVRFDADAVDLVNPGAPLPGAAAQGLVQGARILDAATLGFMTGPRFGGFRVTSQPSDTSMRQTIEITPAGAPALSEAPDFPRGESKGPPDLNALTSAGNGALRTIAIDPGHGGDDEGAKGAGGLKEKDLTLAVARKLKTALESKLGVHVLLTRDDDRSVAIDDRTAVANNGKADLFISLHANASWRPALSGASIAIASFPHQAEEAARTLQPELVPAIGGAPRDIEFVPWDIAQLPHVEQSAAFAKALADQLRDHVPLSAKAIDAAPLRVLEPANMPAVLVEMGYVTNAEQEKQLAGDAFQNAFVQALVDGVMKYRDSLAGAR